MQSRLQSPWSPHIGGLGNERGRYEEIPTLPGSFPADIPELADRNSFGIQELPGTIPDEIPELGGGASDVGVAFDWRMPDIAPVRAQEDLLDLQSQQQELSRNKKRVSPPPIPPPPTPMPPNHHLIVSSPRLQPPPAPPPAMPPNHHLIISSPHIPPLPPLRPSNRHSTIPKQKSDAKAGPGRAIRGSGKDASGSRSGVESKTAASPASNNIVIAVFGLTGTGKSSFISKLTGKDVMIGHGLQSCTTGIEQVHCKIGLCDVTLVDTPGFDDTNRTDAEVLALIASWMKDAYDDQTRLTGVIYLHRISDPRMSGSSYKNLRMLRSLCGTKNLSHVILATTMWDMVSLEQGAAREDELLSEGKFWGDMVRAGSMVRRYDNTAGGAMALVNELLQKSPVVLKIQVEVAIEKKDLIDTTAGQSINETLMNLSKRHIEDLVLIKEDIAQAVKEKDAKLQKELEATKKKLADQMKAIEDSQRALRRPVVKRAWYQFSWRCKGCNARLKKDPGPQQGKCPGCGLDQLFV